MNSEVEIKNLFRKNNTPTPYFQNQRNDKIQQIN